jgi:hypothetical protein
VPIGHANDGAGSIRLPARHTGTVGLKPTRGRIPIGPDIAEAFYGGVQFGAKVLRRADEGNERPTTTNKRTSGRDVVTQAASKGPGDHSCSGNDREHSRCDEADGSRLG